MGQSRHQLPSPLALTQAEVENTVGVLKECGTSIPFVLGCVRGKDTQEFTSFPADRQHNSAKLR
jgi:hypothetical protein